MGKGKQCRPRLGSSLIRAFTACNSHKHFHLVLFEHLESILFVLISSLKLNLFNRSHIDPNIENCNIVVVTGTFRRTCLMEIASIQRFAGFMSSLQTTLLPK